MADESDTRSEILDAAYTVLVERGYDGFTTRAVAEEAGRNQSLVHYYFETKRDLLLAFCEDAATEFEDQIEHLPAEGPADRLRTLAEFVVGTSEPDDVAFKRVLLELTAQAPYDEQLRAVLARDRRILHEYVAETVREGIERGEFRAVDPEVFAATYRTAMNGAQTHSAVFADDNGESVVAGLHAIVDDYLVADDP